jgi:hypothetical protein
MKIRVLQWATDGGSAEAYAWKTCTRGEVGPDHLLYHVMNCCHSWYHPGLRVSCCQVYTLARLIIDSNLRDTLGHG